MLEETGTKVSIPTVKRFLHRQQGRSHCSKTAIKKPDYSLQLHMGTKKLLFGEMSDETKIELFGHNDHHYVLRKRGMPQAEEHHPNREASGWQHNVVQNKYIYVDILKEHLKTSVRNLQLGCKWTMTPSILPKLWQNGLRTTKSRYWSGHHKALTSILYNICGQD